MLYGLRDQPGWTIIPVEVDIQTKSIIQWCRDHDLMISWAKGHDSPGRYHYDYNKLGLLWEFEQDDDALIFVLKFK